MAVPSYAVENTSLGYNLLIVFGSVIIYDLRLTLYTFLQVLITLPTRLMQAFLQYLFLTK